MKLDPVFLVAPVPSHATMPSRRAFLIAGCTFTLGTAIGGACGYSLGARSTTSASDGTSGEDLKPTGDADLDELRRLAVKAPIEELLQHRMTFVGCLVAEYPDDAFLWRGADRLCEAVVDGVRIEQRQVFALVLKETIEGSKSQHAAPLQKWVPELRLVK